MISRLATSAKLLQSCIQREETASAATGARFSPTRRMRTSAVMERMEENLMTEAGEGDRIVADDQAQDEDEEGADPALKGSYDRGNPRG
jgi:hypothetical protein